MTQEELLENVLSELTHIKTHMPNGELKQMVKNQEEMKKEISELKYMLLNPEDGVIVKTNQNTEYRHYLQGNAKEFDASLRELELLQRWKSNVNKALWILFGIIASIVVRMFMMINDVG